MTALLEAVGVSVSFGGLRALADVTVRVDVGAVIGLIGPNGAGKTTLFNVLSGLQAPGAGSVRFDGRDISRLPPHKRVALGIGRSFQNLGLVLDETVAVNLAAAQYRSAGYRTGDVFLRPWRWQRGERAAAERARSIAAQLSLLDHWDERIADLSFGVARFVELACVLVSQPTLLLLDEPTTGLDTAEIARLLSVLRAARDSGTTILLVAHDVRFVMGLCDYVYVLAEGHVLADGKPADVQADPQVIEAYLGRSA